MKTAISIVGSSAAGLHLARLAAERGREVSVYERARELGAQARTLIVTEHVRKTIGPPIDLAVVNEVRRYELFADGQVAAITLLKPDLVIERSILIRALADRAEAAGARIQAGHRFAGLRPEGDGLCLRFERNGSGSIAVPARAVVGADGANSGVARSAGWPPVPTVPVVQAIVLLPDSLAPDTARVWFRPEDTPYFYWLIPEGPDRGVLGLIGDEPYSSRRLLDGFLSEKGFTPLGYQAARVPAYTRWIAPHRRIGGADVFLVGDAAGHVKISTVGGVHTGFRGAAAVAELLAGGGRSELRGLRRELDRHRLVRRALDRFGEDDYRRLLELIGPRTRTVLGTVTRDESDRLLRRLLVRQPRLILMGIRGLLARQRRGQPSTGTRSSSSARKAPSATIQPIRR